MAPATPDSHAPYTNAAQGHCEVCGSTDRVQAHHRVSVAAGGTDHSPRLLPHAPAARPVCTLTRPPRATPRPTRLQAAHQLYTTGRIDVDHLERIVTDLLTTGTADEPQPFAPPPKPADIKHR
jgi:hypothetical protein